jgi:hypothetical protein
MKSIPLPSNFDGAKFASRYSLGRDDFFVSEGRLYFPDALPTAPVTETTDVPPPNPKPTAAIEALKADTATATQVRDILKWMILRRRDE